MFSKLWKSQTSKYGPEATRQALKYTSPYAARAVLEEQQELEEQFTDTFARLVPHFVGNWTISKFCSSLLFFEKK